MTSTTTMAPGPGPTLAPFVQDAGIDGWMGIIFGKNKLPDLLIEQFLTFPFSLILAMAVFLLVTSVIIHKWKAGHGEPEGRDAINEQLPLNTFSVRETAL